MTPNYKKIYAIQKDNERRILAVNASVPHASGIYAFYRTDELGIRHAYIGQAVDLLQRLAQHLSGYQHIDLSIKKHKLLSVDNPHGYDISYLEYPKEQLDEMEQYWIKEYALKGYQLKNKTLGGQGEGKEQFTEYKPSKGYRDGISQGRKNMAREIRALFDKHLDVKTKSDIPNRYQTAALDKFHALINEGSETNDANKHD